MQEPDTRAFLLAMRRKLVKERELINKQIRACDTLLGGTPAEVEVQAAEASADGPPSPELAPRTVSITPASEPAAPSPFFSPEQKQALLIRAGSKGHGAIQARAELLVAECGDKFSFRDVLSKYEARYGKDRYRLTESIGSSLWKLARKRGYRVARAGSGTLPTLYEKPGGQTDGNTIRSP